MSTAGYDLLQMASASLPKVPKAVGHSLQSFAYLLLGRALLHWQLLCCKESCQSLLSSCKIMHIHCWGKALLHLAPARLHTCPSQGLCKVLTACSPSADRHTAAMLPRSYKPACKEAEDQKY